MCSVEVLSFGDQNICFQMIKNKFELQIEEFFQI